MSAEGQAAGKAVWFRCPVAGRCGGCQLTRLPYPAQLRHKQETIEALLGRYCPVEPIIGMEDPLHYRAKVHAVLATDRHGVPVGGVYEAGTHRVVPVRNCLIEDARASAIIRTAVGLIGKHQIRVYNEYTHRGFLRHILVRAAHETGEIMVILVGTGDTFPAQGALTADLVAACPEITTVVLNVNAARTSMVLGRRDIPLYGPGFIEDTLLGCRFRISPQSFYQVNSRQTAVLYRTALRLAGLSGRELLIDAYCGTGTIGLTAAAHCREVIGIELNAAAVRDARVNAQLNGIANARFVCADAGQHMVHLAADGLRPDVVILDPPRTGSDPRFLSALCETGPARIVYVSCGPDTLARDLAFLTTHGYRAERAVPVDMFPATEHIETVCSLSREAQEA